MSKEFLYRGIENLVYAEVLTDDATGYTTGTVKKLAPVAEIGKATETSSEPKYYDNKPLIVVDSAGVDEVTLTVAGIPVDVLAEITGQYYDKDLGAMIEGEREPKYFAIGYEAKKTNGAKVVVWRYKGTFGIPEDTFVTEDDGTDANGQELTFTGIMTSHVFEKTGKGARALTVHTDEGKANVSAFFETVTTPDTLTATA